MEDIEIRNNFAKNISRLRKLRKMNQAEFAKSINYSDKAISKWENGETMPDIFTLQKLADYFNVTIDDLISQKDLIKTKQDAKNRIIITAASVGLCFVIGLIVYTILELCNAKYAYLGIVGALIASSIVLIVFTSLWFGKFFILFAISLLIWSITLSGLLLLQLSNTRLIIVIIAALVNVLIGMLLLIQRKEKGDI